MLTIFVRDVNVELIVESAAIGVGVVQPPILVFNSIKYLTPIAGSSLRGLGLAHEIVTVLSLF